ncbi:hypothetical protein H9Q73_013484 [Fusarium xylarioides]|nr:hypothetical protein H9Q73_013484 [Fusarium xylarioides]
MSVTGRNALRGSRALLRPLSNACSRDMIKDEPAPKRMQKPKGKRTTRPWPSGLTVPGARAVRRLPADPSAKYTIIKIPNASTAFSSWPTLNKFKSALQPRTSGTIPPGASAGVQATVDTDMEMAILPYLYNDLGVLIFEGPQWEQRKKHTITPKGLYGLTNIALKKWKADGIGGPVPVETVPGSIKMYLVKHIDGPGLANHTINGSYLPQLHVYVATGIRGSTIYMSIEFHTVGTRRLVGVTNLNLKPISEISSTKDTAEKPPKGVDRNTHFDQKFASVEEKLKAGGKGDTYSLKQASQPPPTHARSIETPRELYKRLVPSNTTRNSEIYRLAMFKLYKLEHKLWAQRKRTVGKERKDERRITNFTERHKERLAAVARMEEKYLDANGEA